MKKANPELEEIQEQRRELTTELSLLLLKSSRDGM